MITSGLIMPPITPAQLVWTTYPDGAMVGTYPYDTSKPIARIWPGKNGRYISAMLTRPAYGIPVRPRWHTDLVPAIDWCQYWAGN